MHYAYIVNLTVHATVVGVLLFFALLHFYTAFYVVEASRTIRMIFVFILVGLALMVVRALDPDGCFHVTDVSLRQWMSMLVTAVILGGATQWLVQLVGGVSRVTKGSMSEALKVGGWIVTGAEFLTAIIGCAVAQALNLYWPTSIFLLTTAAMMLLLFGVMTYAAHYVRVSISNARSAQQGQDLKEMFETKLDEALFRLNTLHICASLLLAACFIGNLIVFVGRIGTNQTFMEALQCTPSQYVFDPMLWAQALAMLLSVAYVWQPWPCSVEESQYKPSHS